MGRKQPEKKKKLSRQEQKALQRQKQKEQDRLFELQLQEYQKTFGAPKGRSRNHHMRSGGSQIDMQIEKSKRRSRNIVMPQLVVRAPDYDTLTEQEEEEKTQRELSKDDGTPRSRLRSALIQGLLDKVPETANDKEVRQKVLELLENTDERANGMEMPTTETVQHYLREQLKHSEAKESGISDGEESTIMEDDEDLSNADKVQALKGIGVETPYYLHYAATEQLLTLMVVDDVDLEKYRYDIVLEDAGGVTDDKRKQQWVFGVDGTITSLYNRDFCVAVKNGRIAVGHRSEEETAQYSKTWRVVFIDVDSPTRHKYIALEKNSKLVLDMGRKGLALRVNKDTNDATQKWLVSE